VDGGRRRCARRGLEGPSAEETVIRAEGLCKRYGAHVVLDGLDLRIDRGERVALLGLNGAGKTTLFRCILGLTPFEGRLSVDALAAGPSAREVRRRVGYVPQRPPIFDLSLAEFVELFTAIRGAATDGAAARLEAFGLPLAARGRQPLRELSGGMLQKAFLALALGDGRSVLLLDEPTASLDPESRRDVLRAVAGADLETTVLLATHRLEEVRALAGRVLLLGGGRLLFDGPVEELEAAAADERLLWVELPGPSRVEAARALEGQAGVRRVNANGRGIEVAVASGAGLDALEALRRRGLAVTDFHSRPPELETILERLAGEAHGGPVAAGTRRAGSPRDVGAGEREEP